MSRRNIKFVLSSNNDSPHARRTRFVTVDFPTIVNTPSLVASSRPVLEAVRVGGRRDRDAKAADRFGSIATARATRGSARSRIEFGKDASALRGKPDAFRRLGDVSASSAVPTPSNAWVTTGRRFGQTCPSPQAERGSRARPRLRGVHENTEEVQGDGRGGLFPRPPTTERGRISRPLPRSAGRGAEAAIGSSRLVRGQTRRPVSGQVAVPTVERVNSSTARRTSSGSRSQSR